MLTDASHEQPKDRNQVFLVLLLLFLFISFVGSQFSCVVIGCCCYVETELTTSFIVMTSNSKCTLTGSDSLMRGRKFLL